MKPPPSLRRRAACTTLDLALGALLMLALVSWQHMRDEDALFGQILRAARLSAADDRSSVKEEALPLALLQTVHRLTHDRQELFAKVPREEPHLHWAPMAHLNNPSGACASCTTVLARALVGAGYPVRKVGLEKDGQRALHHVLETQAGGRWILMDAIHGLAFRRPDGHLASAAEVSRDWTHYRNQTPPGYPAAYDYSGYYYTNWEHIPGAEALLDAVPALRTWLHERRVSLRLLFMDVHRWALGLASAGTVLVLLARLRLSRNPAEKALPKTFMPAWGPQPVPDIQPLPLIEPPLRA